MKTIFAPYFVVISLILLMACDQSGTNSKELKVVNLEVKGMTCEHACGGTIKKELAKLPAVDSIALDYQEDREANYFKVYYDAEQLDVEALKNQVNQIADGKLYEVISAQEVESKKQIEQGTQSKAKAEVALNQRMFDGILNGLKQSVLQITKM